jgi:hypothetical protein
MCCVADPGPELVVGGAPPHLSGGVPVEEHLARGRARRDRAIPARSVYGTLVSIFYECNLILNLTKTYHNIYI